MALASIKIFNNYIKLLVSLVQTSDNSDNSRTRTKSV